MVKRKRNSNVRILDYVTHSTHTDANTDSDDWFYHQLEDLYSLLDSLTPEFGVMKVKRYEATVVVTKSDAVDTTTPETMVFPVLIKVLQEGALPTTDTSTNTGSTVQDALDALISTDFAVRIIGGARVQSNLACTRNSTHLARIIVKFGINFPNGFDPQFVYPREKFAIGLVTWQAAHSTNDHSLQFSAHERIIYTTVQRKVSI